MADRVAVMYAGKIVEYGTVDEIFYNPKHPYTWSLLVSMPDLDTSASDEPARDSGHAAEYAVPAAGDAFAPRNRYAMRIDFEEEPPMYQVSDTHFAATWLLHPNAPPVQLPDVLKRRIAQQTERLVR